MISSGFVLALLLAIVGLCESHEIGLHRPPKAKEIRRFALPDDVVVVGMWDSAGVDEELPKEIVEVMCDALESARKCMNVSGHEPLYYGRWVLSALQYASPQSLNHSVHVCLQLHSTLQD